MKYPRIMRALCSTPWMIQPEKLEAFIEFLEFRIEGGHLTPEEIQARIQHPRHGQSRDMVLHAIDDIDLDDETVAISRGSNGHGGQNVAVLPIYGVIDYRAGMDISSGGGFSIERFKMQFRDAMADPNVSAIVLDVDSPGGSVSGVEEMSKEIYQARGKKKIVAVANTLAASAAYYLASSADEIAVTPSGEVGSIGVYMLHQDASDFYQKSGLKNTLIKAGKHKAEGNPWEPLGNDALANLQEHVNDHYDMFTRAVARNRGVGIDAVRGGFGEGRTVMAKKAVKLGMADKVATLEDILKSLGVKADKKGKAISGEAESPETKAETDEGALEAERRQRILDQF